VVQEIEHLPSKQKCKALSSNPNTAEIKKDLEEVDRRKRKGGKGGGRLGDKEGEEKQGLSPGYSNILG
jgi:hypothetical protein